MVSLSVRPATRGDLEWIMLTTAATYDVYIKRLGFQPLPVTEDYGPRIEREEIFIFSADGGNCGVAVVEDHKSYLELFSIAVSPAHQSQGVGQSILTWLDGRARLKNIKEIRLYTNALMERNIRIYEAFGYRETSRRPNPKRPGFTLVDMVKSIS